MPIIPRVAVPHRHIRAIGVQEQLVKLRPQQQDALVHGLVGGMWPVLCVK